MVKKYVKVTIQEVWLDEETKIPAGSTAPKVFYYETSEDSMMLTASPKLQKLVKLTVDNKLLKCKATVQTNIGTIACASESWIQVADTKYKCAKCGNTVDIGQTDATVIIEEATETRY